MESNLIELREQIQEDIIAFCDGMEDYVVTKLCQIVCDNFSHLHKSKV